MRFDEERIIATKIGMGKFSLISECMQCTSGHSIKSINYGVEGMIS